MSLQQPTAIFRGRTIPACRKPELIVIFKLTGGLKNAGKSLWLDKAIPVEFPIYLLTRQTKWNTGYAVLVEKVGLFLEKVGLFWKKPYFFSDCQVLVVWRKSKTFSKKALLFPKLPGFLIIRGIPSMFWKSRACFIGRSKGLRKHECVTEAELDGVSYF